MTRPLEGVRIVEVAAWTFVPGAGALLADLGADVVKVEPLTGDPQRGLQNLLNFETSGVNPFVEIPNRGKRSIGIDLANDAGHDVLLKLVESADVFLTSYLSSSRTKLRIDVDDLRAVNPRLIYARGTGWGSRGPLADQGGFDSASAWATGGTAYRLTDPGAAQPVMQPAAFYDLQGSAAVAGGISAALFHRERTGEPTVVDVSLLGVSMWTLAPDIVSAPYVPDVPRFNRRRPPNPLVNWYLTADGRWLHFVLLQADRFWPEFCDVIGHPELIDDERFSDAKRRFENREECVRTLDEIFASAPLAEWRRRLETFSGVWAVVLTPREVHDHEQVEPNGYLPLVTTAEGAEFRLVAPPMQFDGVAGVPRAAAPHAGEHTEELLLEVGLDWDAIISYKERGGIL